MDIMLSDTRLGVMMQHELWIGEILIGTIRIKHGTNSLWDFTPNAPGTTVIDIMENNVYDNYSDCLKGASRLIPQPCRQYIRVESKNYTS